MLAIEVGSLALNWRVLGSTGATALWSTGAGSTSRNSSFVGAGFASAPAIESRMFFQLAAITSPSMVWIPSGTGSAVEDAAALLTSEVEVVNSAGRSVVENSGDACTVTAE